MGTAGENVGAVRGPGKGTDQIAKALLREFLKQWKLSSTAEMGLQEFFQGTGRALQIVTMSLKLLHGHLVKSSDPSWTVLWLLEHIKTGGSWSDTPPLPPEGQPSCSRPTSRSRSPSRLKLGAFA